MPKRCWSACQTSWPNGGSSSAARVLTLLGPTKELRMKIIDILRRRHAADAPFPLVPTFTDDFGQVVPNIHPRQACEGRGCPIHHPSDHSMTGFKLYWRSDRGIFERICPHGVGHPDPDTLDFLATVLTPEEANAQS